MVESQDGTRACTLEGGRNSGEGDFPHVQADGRRPESGHGETDGEPIMYNLPKTKIKIVESMSILMIVN